MKIKRKFYRKKLPNVFTKEQLVKLFRAICNRERKVRKIFNTKTSVACFLGFICGLRRSEVCHLKKEDVDFKRGELKVVNGKNGKDRIVPLPPIAQRILARWFRIHKDSQWVFPSRIKGKDNPYNPRSLEVEIKAYLDRSNLLIPTEKDSLGRQRHRYAFHTLRHTYATYLWNKTGDILTVKEALGHSRLQTTMIYTHVSPYKLKEKVNEAFSKAKVEQPPPMPNFTYFASLKQEIESLKVKQSENPEKILQLRLAKGEINLEDYQKLLDKLRPVNPIAF